jgi:ribonuclease D
MSFTFVDDPARLSQLQRDLASQTWIALDSEAAGFHRYSDRLCLLQITTSTDTWIVDSLALDPSDALRGPLENPSVEILMHGADYDLRLLDRDLGVHLRGLFDTQVAAAILGEGALGLAALLEKYQGLKLSKKFQRADWARRPLPHDMLEYAAGDTMHLHELTTLLRGKLAEAGRTEWAREECRFLEEARWTEAAGDDGDDPAMKVKGARDLSPREVAYLREALDWRDKLAKARDKAPFRIAGDQALLELVVRRPGSTDQLAEVKGFNPALARQEGQELLERMARVALRPDKDILPLPRRPRTGPGRPPPDAETRAERLKEIRNKRADELAIDRGTLLPNAVVLEIARREPRTPEELAEVPGLGRWQAEVLGEAMLAALNKKKAAAR